MSTAPAEAGVQLGTVANVAIRFVTPDVPFGPRPPPGWSMGLGLRTTILFPREGGDPDWAPAFAGEQGRTGFGLCREQGR
ncbi:hypothetical protein SPHINGO391_360006 [Sphingomonas aurantiaca]|uniref:Uncharacterized protein n=1 Tax=Sphingomonas aurantiaca TaxID=185949 RepID=A0A5E7YH80_9SPHN|nr:hypothetical protein SPHINGO391_360006 [Sphingomonas aurantiaca]